MTTELLRDTRGEPLPDDLVLLPSIDLLTDEEIATVDKADWYEADGILMASAQAIGFLSEGDPIDAGINLQGTTVHYIAHCLHRFNSVDGWYHA